MTLVDRKRDRNVEALEVRASPANVSKEGSRREVGGDPTCVVRSEVHDPVRSSARECNISAST
jgi:hypothetical protein